MSAETTNFEVDSMMGDGQIIGYANFLFKTVGEAKEYARILETAYRVLISGTVLPL